MYVDHPAFIFFYYLLIKPQKDFGFSDIYSFVYTIYTYILISDTTSRN